VVEIGLEDSMTIKPFDEITIFTGKKKGKKNNYRKVAKFKGLIRLTKIRNAPGGIDTNDLLSPKDVFVRLYVLRGRSLTPMDSNGKSDPYLVVSLGKNKESTRSNYCPATLNPDFFSAFEFPTLIPGVAELNVEVWDYDGIGDDLIGSTTIDIEDRWFSKEWRMLKKKPIEWRTLLNPSSSISQGKIELWVDIMSPSEARSNPMYQIAPPPKENYELRVIIWQCKDVTIKDETTQQNDLYVTGLLDLPGQRRQRTDTHLRSKMGFGSFNWRMKFPGMCNAPGKEIYLSSG
jgi:hypothetical protein